MGGTSPIEKVITTNRALRFTIATLPELEVEVTLGASGDLVAFAFRLGPEGNHDFIFAQPEKRKPLAKRRIKIRMAHLLNIVRHRA